MEYLISCNKYSILKKLEYDVTPKQCHNFVHHESPLLCDEKRRHGILPNCHDRLQVISCLICPADFHYPMSTTKDYSCQLPICGRRQTETCNGAHIFVHRQHCRWEGRTTHFLSRFMTTEFPLALSSSFWPRTVCVF